MSNYMKEIHPWPAVIYLFMTLFLIMATPYDQRTIGIFLLLSIHFICSLGLGRYAKSLKFYIGMMIFFAVFNCLFNPRGETAFLYINDRALTKESLEYGMYMGIMVSSMLLWFGIFQDIFDNRKITYLIGSRFPVTGLIISMVFCYYEKFLAKIDKIKEVWNTYGFTAAGNPIKKAGIILSVLLSVMLEDSMETAMSMNARGYGKGKRTSYVSYPIQLVDFVLLAATAVMIAVFIWSPSNLMLFVSFFMLLPVIFNIYKELQWKYYLSKI